MSFYPNHFHFGSSRCCKMNFHSLHLLFFIVSIFGTVIFCQNESVPLILANDSSPTNGTSSDPSAPLVPPVEAQQMAADVSNMTQSSPNDTALTAPQQLLVGGGNGTLPPAQNDPANASNDSPVAAGPSLVEQVANISTNEAPANDTANAQGDTAAAPLSVPTPQVQLQQKGSVVPQVPKNNIGNAPLLFEAQTCSADDCSGRGTCIGTKSFPVCLCNGGSAGTRCQDAPCDPSVNCNSRGFCMGTLAIASCICNMGYSGSQCQYQNGK